MPEKTACTYCTALGVPPERLYGAARNPDLSDRKHAVIYALFLRGFAARRIARVFRLSSRTSVYYACHRVEVLLGIGDARMTEHVKTLDGLDEAVSGLFTGLSGRSRHKGSGKRKKRPGAL